MSKIIESEKNLIAAVLNNGVEYAKEAADIIDDPTVFRDPKHQAIWKAVLSLLSKESAVDAASVQAELGSDMSSVGKIYLKEIRMHWSNPENIEQYCREVVDNHLLNGIQIPLIELVRATQEETITITKAREALDEIYFKLIDSRADGSQSMYEVANELLQKAKEKSERGDELAGEPIFGIPKLDKLINGAEEGDVIIIGARPKVGKSSLGNTIIKYHAENRIPLSVISGEMTQYATVARGLAALSGIPTTKIQTGEFFNDNTAKEHLVKTIESLRGNNVRIEFGRLSIPKVSFLIRSHLRKYGTTTFFIDRVGLFDEVINAPGMGIGERSNVMGNIRAIANDLRVKIVICSQLNQEVEATAHKFPKPHQVYGGTGLLASCTKALYIHNPHTAYKIETFLEAFDKNLIGRSAIGVAEIYTAMTNSGEQGSVLARFHGAQQFFWGNDEEGGESRLFETFDIPEAEGVPAEIDDLPF